MGYEETQKIAYEMQSAYRVLPTMGDCIESVAQTSPDAPTPLLVAMWMAIDAYVDMTE